MITEAMFHGYDRTRPSADLERLADEGARVCLAAYR
ncbi:hypothetical protein KAURM247S_02834 [Kitasatospora aureofaciens]